ncbi:MAG TPA: agmatinase [Verrucomicrobiota bacterium]|jgi:agmatinase|nr:agmatinase [Verrucomicrobiota bacterium]OQC25102.1 MAG: N(1)-aminopropylagmatine ureohydrolase [Verrucomicrobia bacterium ADurb.Bin063]HRR65304.1 agmatinase [Candidatus Paceibacterota bacterium]MBP8015961.1 agmatinase [Verrucomicrobiota bacterium]MDI9373414.1 agmatinase [Verrucomicrobiota bacterium]
MSESDWFQGEYNFLGLPAELTQRQRARAWVLPVPYDATTSYAPGTRRGPAAILAASREVEQYDREFDCEPAVAFGVHTLPPLRAELQSPEAMIERVAGAVTGLLRGKPAPELLVVLGGEHSISAGVARGLAQAHGARDLVAVQVDAHADLRDEYEGSRFSHACAARRILEHCPVFQIGIRNISLEEEAFRRRSRRVQTVFAGARNYLPQLRRFVRGKRVYLTVDVDGLDAAIMPATGTPEPGGLSWAELLDIVRVVAREARAVPVADVVELSPVAGLHGPDFLAARLVYEIMKQVLMRKE